MTGSLRLVALLIITMSAAAVSAPTAPAAMQVPEFTLVGEWIMVSTPIDGQLASRLGNSLGFPDRDMVFEHQGDLKTGTVLREDVGTNVRPLGVWRVNGIRFSATFQLWCPEGSPTCGAVIMRGEFTREDRVRGTMTVFFDTPDPSRPTGLDTWVFNFRGDRVAGSTN